MEFQTKKSFIGRVGYFLEKDNIRYLFANKNLIIVMFIMCFLFLKVFHKIITNGHQRLQPLFDCLLTIIVNGKSL